MGKNENLGGVLITEEENTSCRKLEEVCSPHARIDACAASLFPTGEEEYQLRLTGAYIPPSAEIGEDYPRNLAADDCQTGNRDGKMVSHLIVGDFNPNCWR